MSTTTSSALPIAAIPVERFVERLYAPLAWEATVRLGDPAISSRLVERVLHRAWDERERFATFEALYRHAQDAALAAIEREADRRRDVTRFEGGDANASVPGSLDLMSVDAVRRRIGEGRTTATTPPSVIAVTAPAPIPVPAAPVIAAPAPVVAAPAPRPSVAATAPAPMPPRAAHKPRISMSAARVSGPVAAPTSPRAPRTTGSMNRMSQASQPMITLDEDQKKLAIGGGVALVAIIIALAMSRGAGFDSQARAFAALADSAGPTHETARAELKQVPLAEGDTARLGAGASLGVNSTFGDGARALHITGPASLSLRNDSTALAAIQVGSQRFVTAGMVAAFNTDAAGLVVVQVDSGDLVLVRDSVRVRLIEGSIVRIGTGTPMPLTRDQRNAAFGWRQGRLQLRSAPLSVIATAAKQWFDAELRYPSDRAPSDTASLDVPLASRDSLVDALESALRARAEVSGDRITFQAATAPADARRASSTPANRRAPSVAPLVAPPNLTLPPMPTIPPIK